MGFPFELIYKGRHRVVHGLNCCRCAVAQLPPTEVVSSISVLFGASSFFWARQLACGTASFGLGLRARASGTLSLRLMASLCLLIWLNDSACCSVRACLTFLSWCSLGETVSYFGRLRFWLLYIQLPSTLLTLFSFRMVRCVFYRQNEETAL